MTSISTGNTERQETSPFMGDTQELQERRHTEGKMTKAIEKRTAALPSSFYLMCAGGSILGALSLRASGRKEDALFVGQWAPTFLLLGIYNKLVKTEGHGEYEGG